MKWLLPTSFWSKEPPFLTHSYQPYSDCVGLATVKIRYLLYRDYIRKLLCTQACYNNVFHTNYTFVHSLHNCAHSTQLGTHSLLHPETAVHPGLLQQRISTVTRVGPNRTYPPNRPFYCHCQSWPKSYLPTQQAVSLSLSELAQIVPTHQGWVIRRRRIIRRIVFITYLTVFFKLLRIIRFWALNEICSHKPPRTPQKHSQAL